MSRGDIPSHWAACTPQLLALTTAGSTELALWMHAASMPPIPWIALHACVVTVLALWLDTPAARSTYASGLSPLLWIMVVVLGPIGSAAGLVLLLLMPSDCGAATPAASWLDRWSQAWTETAADRLARGIRGGRAYPATPGAPSADAPSGSIPSDRAAVVRRVARGAALPASARSPAARLAIRTSARRSWQGAPPNQTTDADTRGLPASSPAAVGFPALGGQDRADVCLVVEGCYPYRGGGVSIWLDDLMRRQQHTRFSVVSIQPEGPLPSPLFAPPSNLVGLTTLRLGKTPAARPLTPGAVAPERLAKLLFALSGPDPRFALSHLIDLAHTLGPAATRGLAASPSAWEAIVSMHAAQAPQSSFLQYYWAWQALYGGLLQLLAEPLPRARTYHAVSSGFAGLLAARASLETGRPMLLTEHGIYANERMMEILSATWTEETIDTSRLGEDRRTTLKEVWIRAFDGFARTSYALADSIVCLYPSAQDAQREIGADARRLQVIANGIDASLYSGLSPAPRTSPPTIALIGRIAPIKDIETYIDAVAIVRQRLPALKAYVLGSDTEAPTYAEACRARASRLGLGETLTFAGEVDVRAWLPRMHLVVLTSQSESQPFALLEAGAAGLPVVATDVGSCASLILGAPDESGPQPGGAVVEPGDAHAVAGAIIQLLEDHDRRETCGRVLRQRIATYYRIDSVTRAYRALYERLGSRPGARTWPG